jgi:phosphatidylglycerophosphate synthase
VTEEKITRRPLLSRDTAWAKGAARSLAERRVLPNRISLASSVCGVIAALNLVAAGGEHGIREAIFFLVAAVFIQGRLICNLLDGMVAVEGGFQTKSGELYNELPDRFSDAVIFAAAGYAAPGPEWLHALGWLAAVLSLITVYVRALGAQAGASQQFCGPMAKQHRMAVLTVTCIAMALLALFGLNYDLVHPALGLISAGCIVTIWRRASRIAQELESR